MVSKAVDLVLLGLSIAFATTIRTNGILLLGVCLLSQAFQNYRQRSRLCKMGV